MKILISRTSTGIRRDKKPYKNAYLDTFISIDERTVDDPSKLKHK